MDHFHLRDGELYAEDVPLRQIAEQVGYGDRATFAKLFKQLCGESPGAFRKRVRQADA